MDIAKKNKIRNKWSIVFRMIPILILILIIKNVLHRYNLEVMDLNALFTSLVAGTIFLIGFLISGVLSDHKESEKIPSELAVSMSALCDDAYTLYKSKNSAAAKDFLFYMDSFVTSLKDWFHERESTDDFLNKIGGMNEYFAELEKEGVQAPYILRMKNEQNNIRKMIMRAHTIRATDFVSTAYTIVEVMVGIIIVGLLIIRISPLYVSDFFTLVVSFFMLYMVHLIKDLDNPFDYKENGDEGNEVPLTPIYEIEKVIKEGKTWNV